MEPFMVIQHFHCCNRMGAWSHVEEDKSTLDEVRDPDSIVKLKSMKLKDLVDPEQLRFGRSE